MKIILPIICLILTSITMSRATTELLEDLMKKHISMAMCQARCNNILEDGEEEAYNNNVEHEYCSNICMMKRENVDTFTSMCAFTKICRTRPGCRVACQDEDDDVVEEEEVDEIVAIIKRYQLSQAILRLHELKIGGQERNNQIEKMELSSTTERVINQSRRKNKALDLSNETQINQSRRKNEALELQNETQVNQNRRKSNALHLSSETQTNQSSRKSKSLDLPNETQVNQSRRKTKTMDLSNETQINQSRHKTKALDLSNDAAFEYDIVSDLGDIDMTNLANSVNKSKHERNFYSTQTNSAEMSNNTERRN